MRGPSKPLGLLLFVLVLFLFWTRPGGTSRGLLAPPATRPPVEGAGPAPATELVPPVLAPAQAAAAAEPGEGPAADSDLRAEVPGKRADLPRPPRAPGLVWLFEHATHDAEFPGNAWSVTLGVHAGGNAFADDSLSAIEVPPGLEVLAFDGADESGRRVRIGPGRHDLEFYGLNDAISSLRVTPVVERRGERARGQQLLLFENAPELPGGDVWRLPLDHRRDSQLFLAEDGWFPGRTLSGAEIPPGVEVTFFQSKNGLGLALVLGPGQHRLDLGGFNDAVQSLRVRWLDERE